MNISVRGATVADLERCFELEVAGYPEDEAATFEKLSFRLTRAPDLFKVAIDPSTGLVIGFIVATKTSSSRLTHESMSSHDENGQLTCIHSVCVSKDFRRRGIALTLLHSLVDEKVAKHTKLALLCKTDLVTSYEKAGFGMVGPSQVVHGQEQWFEMQRNT